MKGQRMAGLGLSDRHRIVRSIATFLLALVLGGCATGPLEGSARSVLIAPDVSLTLPRPSELGRSLETMQLVTARFGDRVLTFESRLSASAAQFLMVALDPLGRRLLTIAWSDAGLVFEAGAAAPAAMRPENILADLVILYWPEAVVRRAVAPATLESEPGWRAVSAGGHVIARADYQPARPGEPWSGRLRYENLAWGYVLDIESVEVAP